MKEVLINKRIGGLWWDDGITADFVRDELTAAQKNEDIKIVIDSPGGSVYECISIFNVIRDFCRNHKNNVTTYIQGMAASAASIIALAAHDVDPKNKIIVEDNSAYMIHNCWDVVIGDRNDLRSEADAMEKIDTLIQAAVYTRKTGKRFDEIKTLMDNETWLYGQEIVDNGFANEVIKSDNDIAVVAASKESTLGMAKAAFNTMQKEVQAICAKDYAEKLAACVIPGIEDKPNALSENKTPSIAEGQKMEGCMKMTAEEFKKDNPEAYAAIVADAEKAGVEKERGRVTRLLNMGEKAQCNDVAIGFIRDGSDASAEEVQDKFFERRAAAAEVGKQNADDAAVADVTTPPTDDAEDEKAVMAAFDKAMGV